MAMISSPGTGKTMLARWLPTVLPPLSPSEQTAPRASTTPSAGSGRVAGAVEPAAGHRGAVGASVPGAGAGRVAERGDGAAAGAAAAGGGGAAADNVRMRLRGMAPK